jgi:hypothetical protein
MNKVLGYIAVTRVVACAHTERDELVKGSLGQVLLFTSAVGAQEACTNAGLSNFAVLPVIRGNKPKHSRAKNPLGARAGAYSTLLEGPALKKVSSK